MTLDMDWINDRISEDDSDEAEKFFDTYSEYVEIYDYIRESFEFSLHERKTKNTSIEKYMLTYWIEKHIGYLYFLKRKHPDSRRNEENIRKILGIIEEYDIKLSSQRAIDIIIPVFEGRKEAEPFDALNREIDALDDLFRMWDKSTDKKRD